MKYVEIKLICASGSEVDALESVIESLNGTAVLVLDTSETPLVFTAIDIEEE